MKISEYWLPSLASLAIHLAMMWTWGSCREAQVLLEKGRAAVTLNLLPSIASRAAAPRVAAAEFEEPSRPAPETVRAVLPPKPEAEARSPLNPQPDRERAVREPHPEPDSPRRAAIPPGPVPGKPVQPKAKPVSSPAVATRPPARVLPEATSAPRSDTPRRETGPDDVAAFDSRRADGDVKKTGVTASARTVGLTKPIYPRYSRRHGEEGTLVISVDIRADGRAERIEVIRPSGYSRLDRAALDAVGRARFLPAMRGGKAVNSTKRIAFTFRLTEAER